MRHLTISEFGSFLGVTGNRLVVQGKDGERWETPLSRLRSIRIAKQGISLSSNLILACSLRGIRLYFCDWRGRGVSAVSGLHQHAVVEIRRAQFDCIQNDKGKEIAREILFAKVRNQRAVLCYFGKYMQKAHPESALIMVNAAKLLSREADLIRSRDLNVEQWRNELIGLEGRAAKCYWTALANSGLLPESFQEREGRGALEVSNAALNYGYSILTSYCWSALDNAGLELYAGVLHVNQPGRPSLVLDFMEEYRAWVVDRNVIKLRTTLSGLKELTPLVKTKIIDSIDETMASVILWHGKRQKMENVIQRQAYRFAATMMGKCRYRGIRFKW